MKKVIIFFVVCVLCISISGCKAEKQSQSESKYSLPFLVVDLDGDGIELIPLEQSNVYFDVDGDGLAERTAWVSPDDGFITVLTVEQMHGSFSTEKRLLMGLTEGQNNLENIDDDSDGIIADELKDLGVFISRDRGSDGIISTAYRDPSCIISAINYKDKYQAHSFDSNGNKLAMHGEISCTYGSKKKFYTVEFKYKDLNLFWDSLCKNLAQNIMDKQEYHDRCLKKRK